MRKLGRTSAQRKAMLRGMVTLLLEKGKAKRVEVQIRLPESLRAPIAIGDVVGYADVSFWFCSPVQVYPRG